MRWIERSWVHVVAVLILAGAVLLGQHLRDRRAQTSQDAAIAEDTPAHLRALAHAHDLLDAGDLEGAFDRYVAVLAADGPDPEALSHLGWVLVLAGDDRTGANLIGESRALAPTDEADWMAEALRDTGDPPDARSDPHLTALGQQLAPTTGGGR